MATPYKTLEYKALVVFKRGDKLRIAYIVNHELDARRKPGIGRVTYHCQPCTVRDGDVHDWGRMFRPVWKQAKYVTPVDAETAARMLASGEAKDWS
jgi:hypothetical protein